MTITAINGNQALALPPCRFPTSQDHLTDQGHHLTRQGRKKQSNQEQKNVEERLWGQGPFSIVSLDDSDVVGADNTIRDRCRLEEPFVIQTIWLHENGKDRSVDKWFVGKSPLDGIAKEQLPAPSLAGRDEGPGFSSHELSRKTIEEFCWVRTNQHWFLSERGTTHGNPPHQMPTPVSRTHDADQVNNSFHYLTNPTPEIQPPFSEEGCRDRIPHNQRARRLDS